MNKTPPDLDLAPVRWWQVIDFMRLNFELVQGHDPVADRILSQPWALSSLLEYAFMLRAFLVSTAHFIRVSGERAGLLWTVHRRGIIVIITLGLFARFQRSGVGARIASLIEDRARRRGCKAMVAVVAATNEPVHRLIEIRGGRPLGLGTTMLTLSSVSPAVSFPTDVEIREIEKSEASGAWRRWRLHEVEHVTKGAGLDVAADLLESLPRGKHLALYEDGQEIGFAFARQRARELELGLFPSNAFWEGQRTGDLIAALVAHLGSPVRRLTLTQTHADMLADTAPFDFERHLEQERHFMFKLL
jgi:GNAT superfamily N-acetyltransferase